MKIADRLFGPVLAVFGLSVIWGASRLPSVPGTRFGADLLPTAIGCALTGFGALLLLSGLRRDEPLFDLGDWAGVPRARLAAIWALLGPLLGIFLFDPLGFVLFAMLFMAPMMVLMGARWRVVAVVTPGFVLLLYYVFSGPLRVALPAGPLEALLP